MNMKEKTTPEIEKKLMEMEEAQRQLKTKNIRLFMGASLGVILTLILVGILPYFIEIPEKYISIIDICNHIVPILGLFIVAGLIYSCWNYMFRKY